MAVAVTKYLSSDGWEFDTEFEADRWDETRTLIQKIDFDLPYESEGVEILAWITENFQLLKEYMNDHAK